MDDAKCKALEAALSAQPGPYVVSIERFFDGNDDAGSIGWNLTEHPGMDVFRDVLVGLLRRSDVQAVYAQIIELAHEDGCWPSTDRIFVVGTISLNELRNILSPLKPCEVGSVTFVVPAIIKQKYRGPFLAAWWD